MNPEGRFMSSLDQHIIERYADQPARLPADLRRRLETEWDSPVRLYALTDLDHSLRLAPTWVAMGDRHVALARPVRGAWDVLSIPRSRIQTVREIPGLSATTLTLLGAPGDPPLAVLRYTHRQRRAVEKRLKDWRSAVERLKCSLE